jgi:hypothetical protein
MSQDIEDTANPHRGRGVFLWPAGRLAGGLVGLVGVKGELAQEFAGVGVDDADVQVLDQEQDAGSGVGASDADVEQLAAVAERVTSPVASVWTRSLVSAARSPGTALGRACWPCQRPTSAASWRPERRSWPRLRLCTDHTGSSNTSRRKATGPGQRVVAAAWQLSTHGWLMAAASLLQDGGPGARRAASHCRLRYLGK